MIHPTNAPIAPLNSSFLYSQNYREYSCDADKTQTSDSQEKYNLICQRDSRKVYGKKISFKVKKSSSQYRRNLGVQKVNVKSNKVAELTQKFNEMVTANNNSINGTNFVNRTEMIVNGHKEAEINLIKLKTSSFNGKLSKKPSVKKKPNLDNENMPVIKKELFSNNKNRLTYSDNKSVDNSERARRPNSLNLNKNVLDDFNFSSHNIVQTTIEIFERRSSLPQSSDASDLVSKPKVPLKPSVIKNSFENNTLNKFLNCKVIKDDVKQSDVENTENNFRMQIITSRALPQQKCDSDYEVIKGATNEQSSIKPNDSFLWREKSPTNPYTAIVFSDRNSVAVNNENKAEIIKTNCSPEVPPRSNQTNTLPSLIRPSKCNTVEKNIEIQDCSEGKENYEEIDQGNDCIDRKNFPPTVNSETLPDGYECCSKDENLYEIMSVPSGQTQLQQNNTQFTFEKEEVISNCYETIYNSNYKKEINSDNIYESICSNRNSLVSSEQNSNSLYGNTLWDDNSTYKASSDLSDDWVDVSENEESDQRSHGIVIIREKQKTKKLAWSQHLRDQWTKAQSSNAGDSDSDHHYETLYTASEDNQYSNYESFDSDSDSDFSGKNKFDEGDINIGNQQLPDPPVSQPYGLIKFAEKHMKKLKKNFSRDISKSLSRMTKRISGTDYDFQDTSKEEKLPPKNNVTADSKSTDTLKPTLKPPTIVVSDGIKKTTKTSYDQEKAKSSFLSKIRRSMSLSAESALELTSNLGTRNSTFYLTETIDIDKDEKTELKDEASLSPSPVLCKSALIRPRSPPPPAPTVTSGKKQTKDRKASSWYAEAGLFRNNDSHSRQTLSTSWYAEVGLYPNSSPSTSTGENSDSSNVTQTLDISNDSGEEYYNLKNENYYNGSVSSFSSRKSKEDESFTYVSHDIQMLLQDEPLYQFYDAAVLESACQDGMSETDSEKYEEVEKGTNSDRVSPTRPSAMELVLPNRSTPVSFTRSLWCEIPEVIQSSVLSQLSVRQKKLQEAKFEIITSEASYLNSLNVLNDHFASKIRMCDSINEMEMDVIFGKIVAVRKCSERLLQDLEKCWQDNILLNGICDIIQKHAEENFNVYIPYCENQVLLDDTLKQIKDKPGIACFLKELESSPSCQFLTLYSFLMLPMQRITRLPLLVDAVLKRLSQTDPEYLTCQYALATLNKIVTQCNEAARQKERANELQRISEKLSFMKGVPPIDIVSPDRWLIRSGPVTCIQPKTYDTKMTFGKRFNKLPLHLFLFNDIFLVTKERSDNMFTILHNCPRNLIELASTDMFLTISKKDVSEKNLLFLTILENQEQKTVELLLSCKTESDKERWIEAFTPPKSEDPEETLYECWDCPQVIALHNYNACQPDELFLSRGDVINVFRKMGDGWYNGERIRDGQTGWFPANHTNEIANPHVRARNLKQRYRLLTFSENYLKL